MPPATTTAAGGGAASGAASAAAGSSPFMFQGFPRQDATKALAHRSSARLCILVPLSTPLLVRNKVVPVRSWWPTKMPSSILSASPVARRPPLAATGGTHRIPPLVSATFCQSFAGLVCGRRPALCNAYGSWPRV